MEVEKAPEFNQTPNPKSQKREEEEEEEDIDDKKLRNWMNEVKASREEVSKYLNWWKHLTFEQKRKERMEIVMHYSIDHEIEGQRFLKILVDRAKKEDILNEIKLHEELAALCRDLCSGYIKTCSDKYNSELSACCRKLSKIENVAEKLNNDTSRGETFICTLLLQLEYLQEWPGEEEINELGDTGETYEDLVNRIKELMDLSDLSVLNPIAEVPEVAMLIVFYLKRVVRRKEEVGKGNVKTRRRMT